MKPHHSHPQWRPHLLLCTLLFFSLALSSVQAQNEDSSISVRHDPSAIYLEDDKQIELTLPKDNLPATFYYTGLFSGIIGTGASIVTVNCPGREFIMYAKRRIISWQEWKHLENQPVDEKTAEFASSSKESPEGAAFLDIPFWYSHNLTLVVVSVYFKEMEEDESKQATTFQILLSRDVRNLPPGTPYEGLVYEDRYAFFRVENVKSDGALLISLTSEGETDLFLGQNVRATASNNRFALVSKNKTKVIEIDHTDIDPFSGSWVIGVYGNKDSSFTLTAVIQDQKMINLQPETPLRMSLNESSFVNLNFLLESKRHAQLTFTKDSGEFDLYVNSISPDQELASDILCETHYKWKFSHADFQSMVDFPLQCPLGHTSCIYLLRIEAKSSGNFTLLVNQEEKFLPILNGFQYFGQLKPQESAAYVLKTEETQLNIDMEGAGLELFMSHDPTVNTTNYLWKETLPSKEIIQLKKFSEEIDSNKNFLYIYNPTNLTMNYSFPTAIKSSNTFHLDTEGKTLDFLPYDRNSFLYYANSWETIEVNITLAVALEEAGENSQKDLELALKQRQMIRAKVWPLRDFARMGSEITFMAKSEPSASKNATHILLNYELFLKETRPGKYIIEITNLWEFKMGFEISMNSKDLYNKPIQRMSQNFQYSVEPKPYFEKKFEILMTTPGNWYLWVSSCSSFPNVEIQSNWTWKNFQVWPTSGPLYQETIENKSIDDREDRFKSVAVKSHFAGRDEKDRIYIYSAMANETEFAKYELEEYPPKWIKVSYNYQELKSQVIVKFNPLKFEETVSTDTIRYEVRLLEGDSHKLNCEERHNLWEKPPSNETEFPIDHKEPITLSLSALSDRKYSIDIRAFIIHQSQTIKFVTYPLGSVNTKNPIWENMFMVFVGILACVLVVIGFQKKYSKKVGMLNATLIVEGEGDENREEENVSSYHHLRE